MDSAYYLAFPLGIVHGMASTADRDAHIRQMIEQVLFTTPGERVMYPDFGTAIMRLVFEESPEMVTATQSLVAGQLERWLGDIISIRDVHVEMDDSQLRVDVVYQLVESRETRQERFER